MVPLKKDIIFAGDLPKATLSRLSHAGQLLPIAKGIYVANTRDPVHLTVRRNWIDIVSYLYPGAILQGRSSFRQTPEPDGTVYIGISHSPRTQPQLPGLQIIPKKAPPPISSDYRIGEKVFAPALGRAIIDNLAPSHRTANHERRNLSTPELSSWIQRLVQSNPQQRYIALMNDIEEAGKTLGNDHNALDIVRRAQQTDPSKSPSTRSWDPNKVNSYKMLALHLQRRSTPTSDTHQMDSNTKRFFEVQQSNFIEGVCFEPDRAWNIVSATQTDTDNSDYLINTYHAASDPPWAANAIDTYEDYVAALVRYHYNLMEQHPQTRPGFFKQHNNQIQDTLFVDPTEVVGTLKAGWDIASELSNPLDRALLLHYATVAAHPFGDGNGRVSRLLMNATLEEAGMGRIILPMALKTQYMQSLKALHQVQTAGPYVNTMLTAHAWSNRITWEDMISAQSYIDRTGATNEFGGLFVPEPAKPMEFPLEVLPTHTRCRKRVKRTQQVCLLAKGHEGRCRSVLKYQSPEITKM